jgi:hypothetical protein
MSAKLSRLSFRNNIRSTLAYVIDPMSYKHHTDFVDYMPVEGAAAVCIGKLSTKLKYIDISTYQTRAALGHGVYMRAFSWF